MAEERMEVQRKMCSEVKTNRTVYREPEQPVRWAYLQLLRSHDKTKKIYPINPMLRCTSSGTIYMAFTPRVWMAWVTFGLF